MFGELDLIIVLGLKVTLDITLYSYNELPALAGGGNCQYPPILGLLNSKGADMRATEMVFFAACDVALK